MSERILRALMHLFAIIAKIDDKHEVSSEATNIQSSHGRNIIQDFLKTELSSEDVTKYLNIFDQYIIETRGRIYSKEKNQKRTSLQSVKVLRICTQINRELTQRQKVIVLIRMMEFIDRDTFKEGKELRFIKTVSESFNINEKEYLQIKSFIESTHNTPDETGRVYYANEPINGLKHAKSAVLNGLDALIDVLQIKSVNTLFFKYRGNNELYINGQIVSSDKTHVFNVGSTIKTNKSEQLFYSDLISKINDLEDTVQLTYSANNIIHSFLTGNDAVQKFNLTTNAGKLIGIMGGSGTGKTSLINILNGKTKPNFGEVKINGIDLHEEPYLLEGIIGNVSQSDLLIEELTVFENLYFSAKLALSGLDSGQLTKKVIDLLKSTGLYDIRRLKVGSVLDKVISGGQRKRLNIALELIREPSILFIDEPTSGLSSKDSENIMDLLKELSLKGKLIFTVIHQPSSSIFKLFDRLVILDQGGFPVYDGIPLNAIVHFKTYSYKGNAHERECNLCGNVNPEQIFNLIDAKIIDEFGNETAVRKKSPADWNAIYKKTRWDYTNEIIEYENLPEDNIQLPSRLSQFKTYVAREFFSKIANKQYVITNLAVAPFLALTLSFFIKYFGRINGNEQYTFFGNENIPQFMFIAVVVSIFIGLTVAAEEINKDKKNLEREKFINLSRSSYLLSKLSILFTISAIQTLLFTLISTTILQISGMFFIYWIMLFSTAFLSNIIGLIISSTFNSAKVIYIMIPLIIIPQLLFSGVIVKFDKLHPSLSETSSVPWIGNIMPTRWSYEALTVHQATQNKLEHQFLAEKIEKKEAEWKKDYWIPKMLNQLDVIKSKSNYKENKRARRILINEISKENKQWKNLKCNNCIEVLKDEITPLVTTDIDSFINIVRLQSIHTINKYNNRIEAKIDSLGVDTFKQLKREYANEAIERLTTNKLETHKLITDDFSFYQNSDQIYHLPVEKAFFKAHFYTPYKYIFGKKIKTYFANFIIIWLMAFGAFIFLYADIFRKIMVRTVLFIAKMRS